MYVRSDTLDRRAVTHLYVKSDTLVSLPYEHLCAKRHRGSVFMVEHTRADKESLRRCDDRVLPS